MISSGTDGGVANRKTVLDVSALGLPKRKDCKDYPLPFTREAAFLHCVVFKLVSEVMSL